MEEHEGHMPTMDDSDEDDFVPQETYGDKRVSTAVMSETFDESGEKTFVIRYKENLDRKYAFTASTSGVLFHLLLAGTLFLIWLLWVVIWWVLCVITAGVFCILWFFGFWIVDIVLWILIIANIIIALLLLIYMCCCLKGSKSGEVVISEA
jgi:hypothetical protein